MPVLDLYFLRFGAGYELAKQGYDIKAESAAWAERLKAAKQAK